MAHRRHLRWVALACIGAAAVGVPATASGDLQGGISSSRSKERALQGSIAGDNAKIEGLHGRLTDLVQRLAAIQAVLDSERTQLVEIRGQLRSSRAHLGILRAQVKQGTEALAAQLVADYEASRPDAVSVIFNAHGWTDLLDRVNGLKRIQDQNVRAIRAVKAKRTEVAVETVRLRALVGRQQRITTARFVQRNQIAQIRNAVLDRQLHYERARSKKAAVLGSVRSRRKALERRLTKLTNASGASFAAHGGEDGFFPAPGTDYGYGDEPEIAARLDRMGRALGLHLIGISGYRTPEHSVAVGGFPNDPHTRGQASDTPGVEGVAEATLNRFGLTRPFGGAAEADHLQLAGSAPR